MNYKDILKDTQGSVQIDTAGSLMILAVALAIVISIIGAMIQGIALNSTATDVKRLIETDGKYDTAEKQKISNFLSGVHVNAQVNVSPQKDIYNLGDTFIVTLKSDMSIGANGLSILPITLAGRAAGSCEVYHK